MKYLFCRRSCIQTLETKVAPILAGIIAYLDTNDNMKILQEEHFKWKQELWLTYLNTVDAINLQVYVVFSNIYNIWKHVHIISFVGY
jgi:hypothetical protein